MLTCEWVPFVLCIDLVEENIMLSILLLRLYEVYKQAIHCLKRDTCTKFCLD